MAMQVEGPDEGGRQQPAAGRCGVDGMKIAARSIRDHESSGSTGPSIGSTNWTFESTEPKYHDFAAKSVEVEQQVETRARPEL
jgi:hypothetical protein